MSAAKKKPNFGLPAALAAAFLAVSIAAAQPAIDPAFQSDLLRYVEDNVPVQNRNQNQFEAQCYEQLLLHARRVPQELQRQAASTNINFAHLFGEDRGRYRGRLVRVAGQLRMLRQYEVPETLAGSDDSLHALYEAWIFDERFGNNPYCVVFSELPGDLQAGETLNRAVEADGYFFKRYRYAAKDGWRDAPLLLARTIRPVPASPPTAGPTWAVPTAAVAGVLAAIAATAIAAGSAVVWLRREDRRVREQLAAARKQAAEPPESFPKREA